MPTIRPFSRWPLLVPGLLAITAGCASEREPINRVQANALAKTFFVGNDLSDPKDNPEFYYRPTVVDVDYGASQDGLFTASYAQTLDRIGFEITEDLLVARLTYERVDDTSNKGAPNDNAGQIVAAFKIESHFDIVRDYNPQTGEELNIVNENTQDRPWYERGYFRVDWSQNLITSAYQLDTLAALKAYSDNSVEYEPAAYSVEDPKNADAPAFSAQEGYFDVTNKVFAKPQTVSTPYGTFPTCFFNADFFNGSGPIGNCNPVELKIRLSFKRVEDRDFEPVDWDGQRMSAFGMFTTGTLAPDRLGYDRNLGVVDSKWKRFASRHNIWQSSHVKNADGAPKVCAEDAACDVAKGSRCDTLRAQCTIPYRERTTRPIVFYYGPDSDPSLFESTKRASDDWDSAFRHAVQTARYAECVKEKGGVTESGASASCRTQFPTSQAEAEAAVGPIMFLCHNPVTADDPEVCGKPGLLARVGDLRYHMANIIQSPQTPSPWGIMADAVDPITGEVVAASVNLWNAPTDLNTQRVIDMMRWYNGELSSEDVTQGNYVRNVNYVPAPGTKLASRTPSLLGQAEANARLDGMDRSLADPKVPRRALPQGNARAILDWATEKTRSTYGNAVLGLGNTSIQARFAAIRNTPAEMALLTQPFLSLIGKDADGALDTLTVDRASPLRGGFWQNHAALQRERQVRLAGIGNCVLDSGEPNGVVELAQKLLAKFPVQDENPATPAIEVSRGALDARNQKWRDYIRKRFTTGVIAHEFGHSMGLRHVFTSSADALNFRPQYWQLRTRDKQESTYCTDAVADGTRCVGPRWKDPITDAEREGMLGMWQQTTVMDYPGDLTQDMEGIGAYDRAAVRFLYTNITEVWDDKDCSGAVCDQRNTILDEQIDNGFGGIVGAWYGASTPLNNPGPFHYSRLDQIFNLIRDCRPADTSPPANWNEAENGVYDPLLDGKIVNGTICDTPPMDYVSYYDLNATETRDGLTRKTDAAGRIRRPYMFASDEYADIGNVLVYRHDNGADPYEIASFLMNEYEDVHVFDNHRRGRTTFSLSGAFNRPYTRYHDKLKEMSKGFALLQQLLPDTIFTEDSATGEGLSRGHALATSLVFDHFTRMLSRPTSGEHFLDPSPNPVKDSNDLPVPVFRSTDQNLPTGAPLESQPPLVIPDGTKNPGASAIIGGRPLYNRLDGTKGYYSTQYDLWVGSYYEKTFAIEMLADSTDRFISQSRDDFIDGRYRNVNFATLYPEGMRQLIASTLSEDSDLLGWRIPVQANGRPRVEAGTREPLAPLGFPVWWGNNGPQTCFPAAGQLGCGQLASGAPNNAGPANTIAVDPEVGFEVQKFAIVFSLLYLPDAWKRDWVDLMRIYQIGADSDPAISGGDATFVVYRDPVSNETYSAHSYGREMLNGREVERGIGARVLEWANLLAMAAYEVEEQADTGEITYKTYQAADECPVGITRCIGLPIQKSAAYAARLRGYKSVIDYVRQVTSLTQFTWPSWRGIYP